MSADDTKAPVGDQPTPEQVEAAFGEGHQLAYSYARLLRTEGIEWGLLGPREGDRIWGRHLFNSVAIASAFPAGSTVVDLGTGAGLPGIPLAIARPDLQVVLVEPLARRVRFLELATSVLHLPNVSVRRARAEACTNLQADFVTARALAPLPRLVTWALPVLRPGGELVAIRGSGAAEELLHAEADLVRLGATQARIEQFVAAGSTEPVRVLRLGAAHRSEPARMLSAGDTSKRGPRRPSRRFS